MMPAAGPAASIGIPPLNLSQGPTTLVTPSDGTQTGQNSGTASSGDFVFKGNPPTSTMASLTPVIVVALIGGAAWFLSSRL